VDVISSGSGWEPRRWRPGRGSRPGWPGRRAWLVIATATGAWDRQGLVWVLAMKPYDGYYQLGFWTGAGPLRAFAPARGSPMTLSAPGSS